VGANWEVQRGSPFREDRRLGGPGAQRGGKDFQTAILEQYKTYVELADRISFRRALTNTFFLTLNTLIFTAGGLFWRDPPATATWFLAVPLAALLCQCAAWYRLLRSYRQLNSAKYIVIGVLEERLPASPCWRAEWTALGMGQDPSRYWPLSRLEQWIPAAFAVIYLAGFVTLLAG
jgi:hypothetical protein